MACPHDDRADMNGSEICIDCGLVLGIADWGAPDYDHDEGEWTYQTPSPELSEDVPEKKVALVVDTVCRTKCLRPSISDAAFYVAQDLYSEFFTFKVRKRLKPMLVFDCLLYYVANYQGHYQFYEVWHYNRHAIDLKHWHRCETLLIQTLGVKHRQIFEFQLHLKEAFTQLCMLGGLEGRQLMKAVRHPPTQIHDVFHQMIELYINFCKSESPFTLTTKSGRFLMSLRHRSKAERV